MGGRKYTVTGAGNRRAVRNRRFIEVLVGSGRPGGIGTGISSLAELGYGRKRRHTSIIYSVSLRICNESNTCYLGFGRFGFLFRPNLAPRPVPTGRALEMVQNTPTISPGDLCERR